MFQKYLGAMEGKTFNESATYCDECCKTFYYWLNYSRHLPCRKSKLTSRLGNILPSWALGNWWVHYTQLL